MNCITCKAEMRMVGDQGYPDIYWCLVCGTLASASIENQKDIIWEKPEKLAIEFYHQSNECVMCDGKLYGDEVYPAMCHKCYKLYEEGEEEYDKQTGESQ